MFDFYFAGDGLLFVNRETQDISRTPGWGCGTFVSSSSRCGSPWKNEVIVSLYFPSYYHLQNLKAKVRPETLIIHHVWVCELESSKVSYSSRAFSPFRPPCFSTKVEKLGKFSQTPQKSLWFSQYLNFLDHFLGRSLDWSRFELNWYRP